MAKYNQKTIDIIIQTLADIKSPLDACKAAGIAPKTYYEWLKEKPEFKKQIDEVYSIANTKIKWRALNAVLGAMEEDWRAASFILERKFPEEFGKKDKMDVTTTEKKIIFKIGTIDDVDFEDIKQLDE